MGLQGMQPSARDLIGRPPDTVLQCMQGGLQACNEKRGPTHWAFKNKKNKVSKILKSKNSKFQKMKNPKCQKPNTPKSQSSKAPKFQKSKNPKFQKTTETKKLTL